MRILVNTDKHVEGDEELRTRVSAVVSGALGRFTDRITRVEVHLSDENSPKRGGDDKRCTMEARVEGLDPIVTSHRARNLDHAVDGAAKKLSRAIDSVLQQMRVS